MNVADGLGGPTPDGAGWRSLHGIQLGGIGVETVVEPHRVVVVQGRSTGQVLAVLVASTVGLGSAAFGASMGVWPLAAVFGLLGALPLLALGHRSEIELRPDQLRIHRRNLFLRTSDATWRWDGRWHVRELRTSDRFRRWQLLVRAEGGWVVAAWSSPTDAPVKALAEQLDVLTAGRRSGSWVDGRDGAAGGADEPVGRATTGEGDPSESGGRGGT